MKKVLLLSAVVAVVALSSCKKNYTCTCTISGQSTSVTIHDTKSKATTACDADNTAAQSAGGSCSLN